MGKIKIEYCLLGIVVVLFGFVSVLSISSINNLKGNARVVNFDGIVRGATQKLIKEELMNAYEIGEKNYTDDKLIARLDSILYELDTGKSLPDAAEHNELIVLDDGTHKAFIKQVRAKWSELKKEIYAVRNGADPHHLFDLSQEYFALVNDTVFAAEAYSEKEVNAALKQITGTDIAFLVMIMIMVFFVVRGIIAKRRVDALDSIAYVDSMTGLENRASCDRKITELKEHPVNGDLGVAMFDMNDLKLANDLFGHTSGDRIIQHFANILKGHGEKYGFIGRYGGDEFVAIIENADEKKMIQFISSVRVSVDAHNEMQSHDIEKISFAVGYVIAPLSDHGIEDMISRADIKMYENKRKMRKGRS